MLSLLLSRCFFDDFDDDFEDEDFEEMYIKLPLNKILHFMLLKDAYLRQRNKAPCTNLQGHNDTGVSYTQPLCCGIPLEYISHGVKLLQSKYEGKKDKEMGQQGSQDQNRDMKLSDACFYYFVSSSQESRDSFFKTQYGTTTQM